MLSLRCRDERKNIITYRQDFTLPAELMEQVQAQGLEVLPELIRIVLNAAM